jgi:hypothetical protein
MALIQQQQQQRQQQQQQQRQRAAVLTRLTSADITVRRSLCCLEEQYNLSREACCTSSVLTLAKVTFSVCHFVFRVIRTKQRRASANARQRQQPAQATSEHETVVSSVTRNKPSRLTQTSALQSCRVLQGFKVWSLPLISGVLRFVSSSRAKNV